MNERHHLIVFLRVSFECGLLSKGMLEEQEETSAAQVFVGNFEGSLGIMMT